MHCKTPETADRSGNAMKTLKILVILLLSLHGLHAYAGLKTGAQAPSFSLAGLDGKQYSLEQLRANGPVMLVFWTTDCVYCYMHVSDFNRLQQQYRDKGFTIAAINFAGEHAQEIREYKNDNKLEYLLLADRLKNIDVAQAYKVIGSPTIVLVAQNGKVLFYGHSIPDLAKWLKH